MFKPFFAPLLLSLGLGNAPAAPHATRDQAQAMVKKAVAHVQRHGADKAYADFASKTGGFIDRDLYVTVYRMDGRCVAHGVNPRQVGRNLIDLTDIEGRAFVKERLALAQRQPAGFWQHYKFLNPVSQKVEPKAMYCERLADTVVCGGAYH